MNMLVHIDAKFILHVKFFCTLLIWQLVSILVNAGWNGEKMLVFCILWPVSNLDWRDVFKVHIKIYCKRCSKKACILKDAQWQCYGKANTPFKKFCNYFDAIDALDTNQKINCFFTATTTTTTTNTTTTTTTITTSTTTTTTSKKFYN